MAAGRGKRATDEFGGRPDLVVEGEAQQARDCIEQGHPGKDENWVLGWKLSRKNRASLLGRFPPSYAATVADHVTSKSSVYRLSPLPPDAHAELVGRADDGRGLEAYIVEIDGTIVRDDGGTYHITWSLDPGRRADERALSA